MPEAKVIKKRSTIEVPISKQINFNDVENGQAVATHSPDQPLADGFRDRKKSASQQKTVRLDDDLFQAVKLVAKSLDTTEQDFIIYAIKKEINQHLSAAKERLTAQIASLPSMF